MAATVIYKRPTTDTRSADRTSSRRKANRRKAMWIWLFLVPTIVLYGAYTLYPIIGSYWYSLVDWNGFTSDKTFNGLANYRAVMKDPLFWNSMKVTLIFMLAVAPLRIFLSFLLAILLNSPKLPFSKFFRTMFFLPVVTTTAIVGVVMQFIFDPVQGPVNHMLKEIGLINESINFLSSSSTSLYTVAGVYIWKGFGTTMIYWLAALQTIPEEIYEAARIDGAGFWRIYRHVTLPMLAPFVAIISLLTVEETLHAFDLVLTMTNGGPFYSSEVIEVYIYRWGFAASIPQLGYASAAAVIFGVLAFALIAFQIWGVWARQRGKGRS